jgi:GGDEF domain-containing protein
MVSQGLASAVLDALPDATAVLDKSESIVAVNHTWQMFARDNGGHPGTAGVGVNYLDLCARSAPGCEDARAAAVGFTGALAEPHLIHGQSVQVPASVGTHLAGPGDRAGDALRRADRAMYIVKRAIHPDSGGREDRGQDRLPRGDTGR